MAIHGLAALRSLVLSGVTCGLAACTPVADPPTPSAPARAPGTSVEAAAPALTASAASSATVASVIPARSDPSRFRCGGGACRSGQETCCGVGPRGVCVASSPNDGPVGAVGYLKTQWEACDAAATKAGASMSGIDRCDESSDCHAGAICCEQFLFSGGTNSECESMPASGKTPCQYGERCIEDATCRLPGTRCVDGYCQKPVVDLRCNRTTCSGSTPVCCNAPAGCQALTTCPRESRVRCTKSSECLPGQTCSAVGTGTECAGLYIATGHEPLCARDAECVWPCPEGKRARCKPSQVGWLKSCQCP